MLAQLGQDLRGQCQRPPRTGSFQLADDELGPVARLPVAVLDPLDAMSDLEGPGVPVKAAPAAPRPALPAPGSALGGPPSAPAPSRCQALLIQLLYLGRAGCPVFLGFDCPDRGHRVQGGPPGRRTRSATPTLDLAATHLVLAPTRRTGQSS
jgi:hypothetical protein